ncbi:hypothetical protein OA161_00535 [Candidatus Pelagibacter sp.]|nr:hypothetical protein [Candidatus Pelagibacter sp.]
MALFTYFDCESDAGAAQKATCLSVAAVTVNENFKIVDQWKINSRFRASRAFEVDAMLAHNIPVEVIEKEKLSNSELVDEWEKRFKALAEKGTIFVGYNSMNYDNILLQNSLYINLKWPYITNKEQFDLLPAIRAASVFAPGALNYELNEKGNTSFRLQSMLSANGIETKGAHDSLYDTIATKDLAQKLFEKAPEVFNASIALRKKADVLPKIKEGIFCWHEAYFKAKIYCGMYLGATIFPGWYYLYDLRKNPEEVLKLDRDGLKESLKSSPKYIRTCKSNRAPIIMNSDFALLDEEYKAIGMTEIKKRYNLLKRDKEELAAKIRDIVQEQYEERQEFNQEELQPEEKIYSLTGELSNEERNLMSQFNKNDSPKEKKRIFNLFKRNDIKVLAEMKLFDDYDGKEEDFCKILTKRDFKRVKKRIAKNILDMSDKPSPFIKIPAQQARLDTLKIVAEKNEDHEKMEQLDSLDRYLEKMKLEFAT